MANYQLVNLYDRYGNFVGQRPWVPASVALGKLDVNYSGPTAITVIIPPAPPPVLVF